MGHSSLPEGSCSTLMALLIYIITFTFLFIFFTKINFNVHPFKVYRLVGFHVSSV